ncbi:type IV conjugative transfer system protein TraE [Vibrio sp. S11_S32]|uniref:type IV conjugative transfer system protein TraE n=1 Tax=Vibrio sp. S11_S32 TaxID=2720225 RepID=UPI0016815CA5|nr:type IV conjugative transfer system protein TraE [Vibrio sp. S11_S32]MBD1576947.1 type IV conjugative transfer system protein TraE [Vibrio sp. S11_S32]
MDISVKRESLAIAKGLNVLLLGLVAVLLILTLVLGFSLAYVSIHKTRTLVPPTLTQPVTLSETKVDGAYLSQMGHYFLWLKMNVSPESVVGQYAQILKFVDSDSYHIIEPQFAKEAKFIKSQKVSSSFFIEKTQVDVKNLIVRFNGTLKKYALGTALPDKRLTYDVHFAYHAGNLTIVSIVKGAAR